MQSDFERYLQENPQWSESTRTLYLSWSRSYGKFLSARSLTWQTARRSDLEDFQQQLLWTPNGFGGLQSANTIYQGLRCLRAFYRWAVSSQLIRNNPMKDWILSRPASNPRNLLSWEQTQELFRKPDLGRPEGHRDLLALHLVYHGFSLRQCIQLETRSELSADDTLQAVRARYLAHARVRLMGNQEHTILLVTIRGLPFATAEGLRACLRRYAPKMSALILQNSRRAHEQELGRRLANPLDA